MICFFLTLSGLNGEKVFLTYRNIFVWGGCLGKVKFLSSVHEANAPEHSKMDKVKLGMLLPHEVASAFYHFRSGDLFFGLLTGTPDVT